MKKSIIVLLILAVLAGIGLTSCKNDIQAPVDELVSVSFENESSRALSASIQSFNTDDYYWYYAAWKVTDTALKSGQTSSYDETGKVAVKSDGSTGLGVVSGFSQGYWKFKLFGYIKDSQNNLKLVYQGENTLVLLKSSATNNVASNTVNVTVSPVLTGGNGTLVVLTDATEENHVTMNQLEGNAAVYGSDYFPRIESITLLGTSTPSYAPEHTVVDSNTTVELAPGTYMVTVAFSDHADSDATVNYARGSVVVTVYSNLTTTIKGSLDEASVHADLVAHYYEIQSDGSWNCQVCENHVLEGTESAYITVIENSQPTEIIPLTENATVGNGSITINGNEITYTNSGAAQEIVIRTTSANATLTINAPNDVVRHYDSLGSLNIIESATASYHENGKVAYAEIAKGRIVLESGAKVEEIHVNKKTDSSFDTVIIANNGGSEELPDRITRDAVSVEIKTLVVVVESNDSSEEVFVYANGVIGTTEKVTEGENKQNEAVNSALGQLVLDNGGQAGEKAQTADEKTAAKEEAVEEAVIDEIETSEDYVARIGTTPYETLQDAWNVGKNKTIVLLKDLTQNGFYAYGTYTLDLNGHNLTLRGHSAISGAFGTDGGGNSTHTNLTIQNGTLNLNGENYSTYGIYNYGTVTLKDLTINSACQTVVYSIGQQWGSAGTTTLNNVTINATHSSGTALAAYAYKSSYAGTVKPSVVVKDSTISAANNAVMMYGVDADVENCAISATNNNALWISNSATGSGVTGTVTVKGNTSISAGSDYKRLNAASGHTISIITGTYDFDPTKYVAEGYAVEHDEVTGKWNVEEAVAYAVNYGEPNTYYASLEKAIAASEAEEDENGGYLEIHLLKNVEAELDLRENSAEATHAYEIWLDGHELSGSINLLGTTLSVFNGSVSANITMRPGVWNCALNLGSEWDDGEDYPDGVPVFVSGTITMKNDQMCTIGLFDGSTASYVQYFED